MILLSTRPQSRTPEFKAYRWTISPRKTLGLRYLTLGDVMWDIAIRASMGFSIDDLVESFNYMSQSKYVADQMTMHPDIYESMKTIFNNDGV